MNPKAKRQLREVVSHFGLEVKYVRGLPDKVSGFLQPGPDPQYIFLNQGKSHSDHVFTVAHELGHCVMHLNRLPRNRIPGYLDHPWKSELLREASQITKRWAEPIFESEGEADAWAFALLLRLRATDDLLTILQLYPKKFWIFFLICMISTYRGLKMRIKNFFRVLFDTLTGKKGAPTP